MIACILHVLAFLICLNVQSMNTLFAWAWVPFFIAGCAVLLYQSPPPKIQGALWWTCLAWLTLIAALTFLITPVNGGATYGFVLAATPALALCLRKEHIKKYIWGFGSVITLYASGLILQMALGVQYSVYNIAAEVFGTGRYAWPLLDPNNAAAVVNIGFLSTSYLAFTKDKRWWALTALFTIALFATGSRGGGCAALLGSVIMATYFWGYSWLVLYGFISAAFLVDLYFYHPDLILTGIGCFTSRLPIWITSWPMVWFRPMAGLGFGMFGYYYSQLRTEHYTGGWYAHNDLLQFAIEGGLPLAVVFITVALTVALTTCRRNMASGIVFLAVFLEALVEFQFYVPAVALPMGLVLGYHIANRRGSLFDK